MNSPSRPTSSTIPSAGSAARKSYPWRWIPTLYFAEGVPNAVVTIVAVVMYKRLGLSNELIALYTSWLYLPWVIKPFWSPVVDSLRTKRWWILLMQLFIGAAMGGVAFTLPMASFLQWTLAFFWLMAFSSATHDIVADGYYMLQLTPHEQALFVGIRSTFYRLATIATQGVLIMIAGMLEIYTRQPQRAWTLTFFAAAVVFLLLCLYHTLTLPRPAADVKKCSVGHLWQGMHDTVVSFFRKPHILAALAFMLFYRFPEALLSKVCPLFLLDSVDAGGLDMTTAQIGLVQGSVGIIGLTLGGILGGVVVARHGFGRWLWPMVAGISLPNVVYILLAYFQPDSTPIVGVCVFVEQFGYGFGFTAYMLYLIYFSQGAEATSHYAFCTGVMALSLMLPGMVAGWLQERVGYLNFFIIVMALIPITFLVSALIRVEKDFGRKDE